MVNLFTSNLFLFSKIFNFRIYNVYKLNGSAITEIRIFFLYVKKSQGHRNMQGIREVKGFLDAESDGSSQIY